MSDDLDQLRQQRLLALEKLRVREELRSKSFEEDSQVIHRQALANTEQTPQSNGMWNTLLSLVGQVPTAHKVVVVLPIVLFVLYLTGWQLGMW